MNYFDNFSLMHSALAYHALDLGYQYDCTTSGGTIYLVIPENPADDEDELLQKIQQDCPAMHSWPMRQFKWWPRTKQTEKRKPRWHRYAVQAYVFHLWSKKDRKVLESVLQTIQCLAALLDDAEEIEVEEEEYDC